MADYSDKLRRLAENSYYGMTVKPDDVKLRIGGIYDEYIDTDNCAVKTSFEDQCKQRITWNRVDKCNISVPETWTWTYTPLDVDEFMRGSIKENDRLAKSTSDMTDEVANIKKRLNAKFGLESSGMYKLEITDVIFNEPATIVFWNDGSKTVVKCGEGETFDNEKGLALAIVKRLMGTNKSRSNFNDIFKKWIPDLSADNKKTEISDDEKLIFEMFDV